MQGLQLSVWVWGLGFRVQGVGSRDTKVRGVGATVIAEGGLTDTRSRGRRHAASSEEHGREHGAPLWGSDVVPLLRPVARHDTSGRRVRLDALLSRQTGTQEQEGSGGRKQGPAVFLLVKI